MTAYAAVAVAVAAIFPCSSGTATTITTVCAGERGTGTAAGLTSDIATGAAARLSSFTIGSLVSDLIVDSPACTWQSAELRLLQPRPGVCT